MKKTGTIKHYYTYEFKVKDALKSWDYITPMGKMEQMLPKDASKFALQLSELTGQEVRYNIEGSVQGNYVRYSKPGI